MAFSVTSGLTHGLCQQPLASMRSFPGMGMGCASLVAGAQERAANPKLEFPQLRARLAAACVKSRIRQILASSSLRSSFIFSASFQTCLCPRSPLVPQGVCLGFLPLPLSPSQLESRPFSTGMLNNWPADCWPSPIASGKVQQAKERLYSQGLSVSFK